MHTVRHLRPATSSPLLVQPAAARQDRDKMRPTAAILCRAAVCQGEGVSVTASDERAMSTYRIRARRQLLPRFWSRMIWYSPTSGRGMPPIRMFSRYRFLGKFPGSSGSNTNSFLPLGESTRTLTARESSCSSRCQRVASHIGGQGCGISGKPNCSIVSTCVTVFVC